MTIVNDNSTVVNKLEASLTDNARVILYDHRMFIVQTTAWFIGSNLACKYYTRVKLTDNPIQYNLLW